MAGINTVDDGVPPAIFSPPSEWWALPTLQMLEESGSLIYGTGVDIVEIGRFERFQERGNDALFRRLFTSTEIDYCAGKKHSAQHYALRFAAKESFLKALGTGLRDGLSWQDIEVVNDQLGKPELKLHGRALQLFEEAGLKGCFLSLSHDAGCAVAMVVLER